MKHGSRDEHPTRALRLLDRLTLVSDESELERLLDRITSTERPFVVSFVNAHAVNLACRDQVFFDDLMASDVLLRDGSGMRIMCRAFGKTPGLNLNGTDLIPSILGRCEGRSLALCGTTEPYLSEAASKLTDVVLQIDGFQSAETYVDPVHLSGARLAVLAMGMPKQELVAQRLRRGLEEGVLIINGGAILDFIADRFIRAPRWMRSIGLEWVYRFAREPERLWSRYMVGNAVFIARVARLKLQRAGVESRSPQRGLDP